MHSSARITSLELLADLRDQGQVTEETFQSQKTAILAGAQTEAETSSPVGRSLLGVSKESFVTADRWVARLFHKILLDQALACPGFVILFELLDRRVKQAGKIRLWAGVVAGLSLIGAVFGSDTVGIAFQGIMFAVAVGIFAYIASKWRGALILFRRQMMDSIERDPEKKAIYQREIEEHNDATRFYAEQMTFTQPASTNTTSGLEKALAFGVGAKIGYDLVASESRQKDAKRLARDISTSLDKATRATTAFEKTYHSKKVVELQAKLAALQVR